MAMAADDAVMEAPYCVVCRRSSAGKWPKHVFSRGHQQAAQQYLLHQVSRLQALGDTATASSSAADWYRCVFCDAALATADALTHFASDPHRKQVEAFCRQHRCDADRQTRPKLWLTAARRRELEAALTKREADDQAQREGGRGQQQGDVEIVDQATSERVEAFLSSAASRLQEVKNVRYGVVEKTSVLDGSTREQQQEALLGPQIARAIGPRRCKTVTSSEGVVQNALGRHEGTRVWGGGIVKLRKAEWIPWAIDQLVREEQVDHPETQQTGVGNTSFAHRVTELARGQGLSSVTSVSWGACVGNIHTAAIPPWMVQTEEEYKQCNRREQVAPSAVLPTNENDRSESKRKKKSRDIFSELESKSEYGPNWLPNFGGVWQDGPRSKTKQAFRKTATATKSSRDLAPPRPTEPNPPQVNALAPAHYLLSAKPQLPPPPMPPQPSAAHRPAPFEARLNPQREAPTFTLLELPIIRDDKSKPANALEAKKKSLVAQKERLRAKMAARRRQS